MYKNQKTGDIEEPTMYSIKGGGEWYDASYHGLLVHRNY
jgi:twinkle protein